MGNAADHPATPDAIARGGDPLEYPLARWAGAPPPAPEWFARAIADRPEARRLHVEGAGIEILVWGEQGAPGIVLLHGFAGHAHWWAHIAPYLAARHRVVAVTWSGMGNSDWRASYCVDQYAREAIAAAEAERLFDAPEKPVFIAHSLGGVPLLRIVDKMGSRLAHAVLIDTLLKPSRAPATSGRNREVRFAPDPGALIERFRLSPPAPCANPFILDHFARLGIVAGEADGAPAYRWGMDPNLRERLVTHDVLDVLDRVACPVTLLIGERSGVIGPRTRAALTEARRPGVTVQTIPEAGHHILADEPIALISALGIIVELNAGKADPDG
jgi:pimeloyl-ACP methyl ester carboxylesterase